MRYVLFLFPLLLFLACSTDTKLDQNAAENGEAETAEPTPPPTQFHVVVISGMDSDPTEAQIAGKEMRGSGNSGMFQLVGDLKEKGFECSFYNWNGTEAGNGKAEDAPGAKQIADDMTLLAQETDNLEFLLVGHSWGGHTIMDVATLLKENQLVSITKAIVVDPSSTMRGKRAESLPENIPQMDNYYTANTFCWGEWKDEQPRINNVFLGDPENGFCVDGHPNYAGFFDWKAHVATEWDQKIHAAIIEKLEAIRSSE